MDRPTATIAFFLPRRWAMRRYRSAEEGVGAADPDGGLAEHPGQVPVAFAGAAVALLPASGFGDPGGVPRSA